MSDRRELHLPQLKSGLPIVDTWGRRVARAVDLLRDGLDSLESRVGSGGSGGPPTGAAGGDLRGTYPDPEVDSLKGVDLSDANPVAGQRLTATGPNSAAWLPTAGQGNVIASYDFTDASTYANHALTQGLNSIGDGIAWKYGEQNGPVGAVSAGNGIVFNGQNGQAGLFAKILDLAPTIDMSLPWGVDIAFSFSGALPPASDLYHELAITDYQYNTTSYDIPFTSNTNGNGVIVKTAMKLDGSTGNQSVYSQRWDATAQTIVYSGTTVALTSSCILSIDVHQSMYSMFSGASVARSSQRHAGNLYHASSSQSGYTQFGNLAVEFGYGYDTRPGSTRNMVVTLLQVRQ